MTDTYIYYSSTMFNKDERIHEIKSDINRLLFELDLIEPNKNYLENFHLFNLTKINCSINDQKYSSLSHKHTILHSTTYHDYKKLEKKSKKPILTQAYSTSTPKKSSSNEKILLKPYLTSTPRRNKQQSTNIIPLKRLLYKDSNRPKHSAKKLILPIKENPQWI